MRLTLLIAFSAAFFWHNAGTSQSTPGGVGTTTTTRFWYDAADFSGLSNGSALSSWTSKGGNTGSASQSSSSNRPTVRNNVTDNINGVPVVRFDGSNDHFDISNTNDLNTGGPWTERTFVLVFRTSSDTSTRQVIYEEGGSIRGFNIYIFNGELYVSAWNINNDGAASPWGFNYASQAINSNTTYLLVFKFEGGALVNSGTITGYTNGGAAFQDNSIGTMYAHSGEIVLGASGSSTYFETGASNSEGFEFNGDISEFIIYNYALPDADRFILENSLAAKYDLSLLQNNLYTWDDAVSGDFDFNVIAIGQDNGGNNNASAEGESVLSLSNAVGLSNNEYLFVGDDNGSVASWTTTESPDATSIQRVGREWRIQEVGDVGNIDVGVDVSSLPSLPSGYSYAILVDDDGDFSSGSTVYELSLVSGTDYTVSDVSVSNGNYATIAVFQPAISFATSNSSGAESQDATIDIQLNHIPRTNKNFTIGYSTTNGTATAGADYTGVIAGSSSVTFTAGSTTTSLPAISVTNDGTTEADETFTVSLSANAGFIISPAGSHTYTILDDDNSTKISFSSSSSSGNESVTSVNIPVTLNAVAGIDVSATYTVTGGTASGGGSDYTLASGTVTILSGNLSENISLTIVNDAVVELDETIIITLSNPSGGNLQSPIQYTYTIVNDDLPVIGFVGGNGFPSEGSAGSATVEVSSAVGQDITVNYTVSNVSTTAADQTNASGAVTILSGQTATDIIYTTLDDCEFESTEQFRLTITSVSYGTVGTTFADSVHTVFILDDDVSGPGGVGCGLEAWYRGDAGITTSGSAVSEWADQSSVSYDMSQSSSGSRPTLVSGSNDTVFSYLDYVTFDGSSDYLAMEALSYTGAIIDQVYAWTVFRTDMTGGSYNDNWSFLDFDRSEYWNMYVQPDGRMALSYNAGSGIRDIQGTSTLNDNIPHIGGVIYDNSTTFDTKIRVDGSVELNQDVESNGDPIGTSTTRFGFMGDGSEASGFDGDRNDIYYDGQIAEIIYFQNKSLTSEEVNLIESYLALKYGITLNSVDDGSTASVDERDYRNSAGTVLWDYTMNSTYHNNVFGIVRDGPGGINKTKSRSVNPGSIITIESSVLNNGEALVSGDDNGALTPSTNTPNEVSQRLTRIWTVQESSETGLLTVSFNIAGIGGLPSSASEFALLIDSDTDFSSATVHTTGVALNGDVVSFTNVDLDDGDFYTLGFRNSIVWNGASYANGSGAANAPGPGDGDRRFLVSGSGAVLSSDASVLDVRVTGSSTITINSGITLTVGGNIQNNGTVIVQDGAALVQPSNTSVNSGSGTYRVFRNGKSTINAYNIWSSPITAAPLLGSGGVFNGTNACDLFTYNASTQEWMYDYPLGFSATCNGSVVPSFNGFRMTDGTADGNMDPARGYFIPGAAAPARLFDGTVNNGTITIPVYQTGVAGNPWSGDDWNLVGNPYPSAVRIDSFLAANAGVLDVNAVYFWDDDLTQGSGYNETDDYATVNGLGYVGANNGNNAHPVPPGAIASCQGFWITASTNSNLVFRNSMRVGTDNNKFFKTRSSDEITRFWVRVVSPQSYTNMIMIGFKSDATDGLDAKYDARKNQGNTHITFGSVMDGVPYVIQGLAPVNINENKRIPLMLQTDSAGVHGFELAYESFPKNYQVFLHDKKTGKQQDLQTGTYTTYLDSAGIYWDRFELVVHNNVTQAGGGGSSQGGGFDPIQNPTTGVDEGVSLGEAKVFTAGEQLTVDLRETIREYHTVELLDITGRILSTRPIQPGEVSTFDRQTEHGIYIVRLLGDKSPFVKRIYW